MTFDKLATFVLDDPHVPESAVEMAATLLIDTLAVAAGAADMEAGRIARDHAARFMGAMDEQDQATLLFDGRKSSIIGAGFAAATQIDNLDAHDGYNPTKGHIGCAVVPALCAFAETMPDLSGREALLALAMSYEVAARAAITLHATVSDYHTSGAWNGLGVAALGCRLRKTDATVLRHALGIAEYHGPRSQMMREIANPSMLHDGSGMGTLVGIMAVLQAEDGFAGAPAITAEAEDAAPYWADLGENWTIEQNYIKPYPICRWAHAAIDALGLLLTEHRVGVDDIERVEVHTFAEAAALFPGMPTTSSQAQYSLAFALATRLVHGEIGPAHVQNDGLRDGRVADALSLFSIHEEPRHSRRFPQGRWSDVTIHLKGGQQLSSGDVHAKGGPEAPMSAEEFEAKMQTMTRDLDPDRRSRLLGMCERLVEPDALFSECLNLLWDPVAGRGS
ncbi:MmgE/PrpD family protein [Lutimaribacter marinistellae]|uniref:MmgE/PrpD family protein n=1 Tax=Lutimaribacter marinistellae TaxID=1820329 RepID=A0ABV7TEB7_9RHOB